MGRVGEGGSILSFVIVGVILAGLLVGGIYFINRQTPASEQSQEQRPPQEEEKQSPPPAEPGNKRPEASDIPQTAPSAGAAHELPATGPEETISTLFILGLLGGMLAEYVRSRRARFSL